MARKPVLVGLMVLLLSGAALGVAWQLRPPERLLSKRAVRVLDYQLDYQQEKPETEGHWLDAHTLLLVTGDPHSGYRMPSDWTGKVQRLDTRTGQRTTDVGLTSMLNSLHAEPMRCEPSPNGQFLLWVVAVTPDHYPNWILSSLDGKRHYNWEAGKFEEKLWINAYQWSHWNPREEEENPLASSGIETAQGTEGPLPTVYVRDVRHPEKEQKLTANSPQAHALFASLSPDGKEYVLEAQEGSRPPIGWHLSVYDAVDYHLHSNPMPPRFLPLPLPFTPRYSDSLTSLDHRHILYHLTYEQSSPLLRWLHRLIPRIPAPVEKRDALWVSNLDGSDLQEIGHRVSTDQNAMQELEWLTDNRQVCWHAEDGLYVVSAE